MIRYEDEDFLLSASSIEATFADGQIRPVTNIYLNASTPMGYEWILTTNNNDESTTTNTIRLILMAPDRDWRRNATYAWKLDNAWMSDPAFQWLHWNIESYIDSVIQLPNNNDDNDPAPTILECDRMEFHFCPIGGWKHVYGNPVIPEAKVVLKNVQMGAHMSSSSGKKEVSPKDMYSPCGMGSEDGCDCTVVDGAVVSGGMEEDGTCWQMVLMLGSTLIIVLLLVRYWCRRRKTNKKLLYKQLSPTSEDDLTLTVEVSSSYKSTSPRSTVKAVVNESG